MARTTLRIVGLACLLMALALPAWADSQMVTDQTQPRIEVGARFAGEQIYFFGTLPDPEADVVVKLTPVKSEPLKLMQKGRVVLFWMGVKQFEVENLPYLYKIHSSRPLKEFVTPELATEYRLSYPSLEADMKLTLVKGTEVPEDRKIMFDGFIELKEKFNLYKVAENRIKITKGALFEHYFTFPDKAKEGDYLVESLAIKDGKVIAKSQDVVEVRKVGLTAWLFRMSRENGVMYGIMAVLIAVGAGLLVGSIFKGGGH
ncbi:MAG: TIGR02186 family protein [Deltaproteobacteria bacterium]|nr:TIGR02186 family protein [Deltaproteobacteria bacterium]